jgi:hypothetical protein
LDDCLAELLGAVGVEFAALWKKLTMLRWPFSDLEDATVFFAAGLGVETSLPSIPRAIGGDGEFESRCWNMDNIRGRENAEDAPGKAVGEIFGSSNFRGLIPRTR